MQKIIIQRLFRSFDDLDKAIQSARKALERRDNPPVDILERINAYDMMLQKQRELAASLCGHAGLGNWEEVSRHVRIINGLSMMIRDDAREIVGSLYQQPEPEQERPMLLC